MIQTPTHGSIQDNLIRDAYRVFLSRPYSDDVIPDRQVSSYIYYRRIDVSTLATIVETFQVPDDYTYVLESVRLSAVGLPAAVGTQIANVRWSIGGSSMGPTVDNIPAPLLTTPVVGTTLREALRQDLVVAFSQAMVFEFTGWTLGEISAFDFFAHGVLVPMGKG